MIDTDEQYREQVITKVTEPDPESGWRTITTADGWQTPIPPGPIEPQVGHVVRFYGRGIGYLIRGVVIDGQVFYYGAVPE